MDVKDVALGLGAGVLGVLIVCLISEIIGIPQSLKVLVIEYSVGFLLGLCFYILKKAKAASEEDDSDD